MFGFSLCFWLNPWANRLRESFLATTVIGKWRVLSRKTIVIGKWRVLSGKLRHGALLSI